MKKTLQVSIPTFNRPGLLQECLDSLIDASAVLTGDRSEQLCIGVYNNSIKHLKDYQSIFASYRLKSEALVVGFRDFYVGPKIKPFNNIRVVLRNSHAALH
jgi:hypothetical protein